MDLLSIDVPATNIGAAITICGEKPGDEEAKWHVCPRCQIGSSLVQYCNGCSLPMVKTPQGWVGRAGKSLQLMAKNAEIREFNKTNVVKCIDGGVTSGDFKKFFYETVEVAVPTPSGRPGKRTKKVTRPTAALEVWIDRLRSEILANKPNVIVAAGNEALYALTGEESIESYRGSLLESTLVPGLKVVPILHPASIWHSRRWEYYYVTISDLKRAMRESVNPIYNPISYPANIHPQWSDVVDFITVAMQPGKRWCLDLETRGEWIACVGLSYGTNPRDIHTLCVPIQTTTGPYWTPSEEAEFWRLLGLLMARNPLLVGQNLFSFDLDHLLDYGCEPSGVYMDTMSAFALCYPEFPKALDFIVSLYGTLPYYKMDSKTWGKGMPDEQLFTYNTKDTFSTLEVTWKIEEDLRSAGLWDLYNNYVLPVHWMALEAQKRRIPVSVPNKEVARSVVLEALGDVKQQREEMLKKYEPGLAKYAAKKAPKKKKAAVDDTPVEPITAANFNTRSPLHMQALVYGAMGLPVRHDAKTKAITVGEEALMDLIAYYPEKTADLKLLMREKHLEKALDYVEYRLTPDNYLACSFNFPGTKSFRFSMSKSPKGYGFNGQTPPRWSRVQFVPPAGRVFIARDLAQVEARVVAALANCRLQLERFANPNWSIHKDLGLAIYGEPVVKDTPRYTAAKSGIHGGNFREGPLKMARNTGAPLADTKLALAGYHRLYSEIKLWHTEVRHTILTRGQLVNPFGFRRIFYKACGHVALQGMLDETEWNQACSAVPQSVPPFIINPAMIKCMEALPWVWFHHQGHDSYLASVPVGRALEADAFMKKALEVPITFHNGVTIVVPSEAQIGYTWLEMMPLGDQEPTRDEWEKWRAAEEAAGRGRSKQALLQSVFGIL